MRDLALGRIVAAVIERFKFWVLRKVGRTTVNRYPATLRRGLGYAWRTNCIGFASTLGLSNAVPTIKSVGPRVAGGSVAIKDVMGYGTKVEFASLQPGDAYATKPTKILVAGPFWGMSSTARIGFLREEISLHLET
jgi:hypothetical protein